MKKLAKRAGIGFLFFVIIYWCIGIIRVPSFDMKATFQKDDILLYRKYLIFPNHQDIVVYRSDYSEEQDSSEDARYLFIQRIVALPGDSIFIDSNVVYVNRERIEEQQSFQKNHIVQLIDSIEKIPSLNFIEEKSLISKYFEYAVSVSKNGYFQLKKDTSVLSISYELEHPTVFEDNIFPYNQSIRWNKHFWGPMYLPKKGDKMALTKDNLLIYLPLIQEEEKSANVQNDSLFINNQYINEYEFKDDYYFVMGDNRDNAVDSRYLGPVRKRDIVGIVFMKIN